MVVEGKTKALYERINSTGDLCDESALLATSYLAFSDFKINASTLKKTLTPITVGIFRRATDVVRLNMM